MSREHRSKERRYGKHPFDDESRRLPRSSRSNPKSRSSAGRKHAGQSRDRRNRHSGSRRAEKSKNRRSRPNPSDFSDDYALLDSGGKSNGPVYVAGFEEDNSIDSPSTSGYDRYRHDYQSMNMQQLEARRKEEMQNQDLALDAIHQGVIGLKHHAIAINDEVVDQNKMLDHLGQNMDNAQVELEKETAKAEKMSKKKAGLCRMYCFIVVLLIVLLVIIFLPSK